MTSSKYLGSIPYFPFCPPKPDYDDEALRSWMYVCVYSGQYHCIIIFLFHCVMYCLLSKVCFTHFLLHRDALACFGFPSAFLIRFPNLFPMPLRVCSEIIFFFFFFSFSFFFFFSFFFSFFFFFFSFFPGKSA